MYLYLIAQTCACVCVCEREGERWKETELVVQLITSNFIYI